MGPAGRLKDRRGGVQGSGASPRYSLKDRRGGVQGSGASPPPPRYSLPLFRPCGGSYSRRRPRYSRRGLLVPHAATSGYSSALGGGGGVLCGLLRSGRATQAGDVLRAVRGARGPARAGDGVLGVIGPGLPPLLPGGAPPLVVPWTPAVALARRRVRAERGGGAAAVDPGHVAQGRGGGVGGGGGGGEGGRGRGGGVGGVEVCVVGAGVPAGARAGGWDVGGLGGAGGAGGG